VGGGRAASPARGDGGVKTALLTKKQIKLKGTQKTDREKSGKTTNEVKYLKIRTGGPSNGVRKSWGLWGRGTKLMGNAKDAKKRPKHPFGLESDLDWPGGRNRQKWERGGVGG